MSFTDLQRFQNRLLVNGWGPNTALPEQFMRGYAKEQALTRPGYRPSYVFDKEMAASTASEPSYFKMYSALCPLSVSGVDASHCEAVAVAALRHLQDLMPVKDFAAPGMVTTNGDDGTACVTVYACVPQVAIPGYQALWRELVQNAWPPPKVFDIDVDLP